MGVSTDNPVLAMVLSPEVVTALDDAHVAELATFNQSFQTSLLKAAKDYDLVANGLLLTLADGATAAQAPEFSPDLLLAADAQMRAEIVDGLVRVLELLGDQGRAAFLDQNQFAGMTAYLAVLDLMVSPHMLDAQTLQGEVELEPGNDMDRLLLDDTQRQRAVSQALADLHIEVAALDTSSADFGASFKTLLQGLDAPLESSLRKRLEIAHALYLATPADQRLSVLVSSNLSDYMGLTCQGAPFTSMFMSVGGRAGPGGGPGGPGGGPGGGPSGGMSGGSMGGQGGQGGPGGQGGQGGGQLGQSPGAPGGMMAPQPQQ